MAQDRTQASRFPSRWGGGWISPSQYITECLCVLIARQRKVELSDQFWQREPWNKIFRTQIPAAITLLKEYSPETVIATLRDQRCRKLQSLRARWLLDPILKEKAAEQKVKDTAPIVTMEKTETIQRPTQRRSPTTKSLFTLLKEAENDSNQSRPS